MKDSTPEGERNVERKVRVGIIGVGKMGHLHARILHRLAGAELIGVADTNLWRAQRVAWRYNCLAYRDFENLLPQVDAAVLATPTPTHYPIGRRCLEAGKHCLIEKPIAEKLQEAEALLELSEKVAPRPISDSSSAQDPQSCAAGLVLQIGHIERFNAAVLEAVRHIHQPRFITVERIGPYDPRTSGISVVLDMMIHDLDIVLTLVNSRVASLEAVGASLVSPYEDIVNARLRFESGCIADLTASRVSLEKSRKIRIFQENGYLSLDYLHPALRIYRRKNQVVQTLKDIAVEYPKLEKADALTKELEHFLHCIRTQEKPWTSGECGRQSLELGIAIIEKLQKYPLHHPQTPESLLGRLKSIHPLPTHSP
ncbi:MAG: Gfo/Idh/MocA family oxidoreductase [Elusimicrobia bacterium]|nr:Gfo/Idh/MocA family oxidoreductase [Elusimicrobiota bacterium]